MKEIINLIVTFILGMVTNECYTKFQNKKILKEEQIILQRLALEISDFNFFSFKFERKLFTLDQNFGYFSAVGIDFYNELIQMIKKRDEKELITDLLEHNAYGYFYEYYYSFFNIYGLTRSTEIRKCISETITNIFFILCYLYDLKIRKEHGFKIDFESDNERIRTKELKNNLIKFFESLIEVESKLLINLEKRPPTKFIYLKKKTS
ncbi:MAG: hypothetical protein WC356_05940 [Candidatus Micrarchaeia archaeon]|jgi:hypothetical protein